MLAPSLTTGDFLAQALGAAVSRVESLPAGRRSLAETYLMRVVESDEILSSSRARASGGPLGEVDVNSLWLHLPAQERTKLGQFFTPRKLAEHIVARCDDLSRQLGSPAGTAADISCGSGVFLQVLLGRRLKAAAGKSRMDVGEILSGVVGVDINPVACSLAKLSIATELFVLARAEGAESRLVEGPESWPLPRIYCEDSLDFPPESPSGYQRGSVFAAKEFVDAVDMVIGNFPFLESKKMNRFNPGMKASLRERFPVLEGAFDLYVPFLYQALRLLGPKGVLGVVLPDKFLVARYAAKLRSSILASNSLLGITDCSRAAGGFDRTSVYPIAVFVGKAKSKIEAEGLSVNSLDDLASSEPYPLDASLYTSTGRNCTWFCQNPRWFGVIRDLYASKKSVRLGQVLDFRSTISFHEKGVREKFVTEGKKTVDSYPYLGGRSFADRNEVDMFSLNWAGYYIRYPSDMDEQVGHTVAPIGMFQRPKLILCQHSQRMRAFFDSEGRYLTKDVYPIASAREAVGVKDLGWVMVGYLNSSFLTAMYNTIYHGITISGGFYHYLPVFLKEVPVILPGEGEAEEIAELSKRTQAEMGRREKDLRLVKQLYEELDLKVSRANGLSRERHLQFVEYVRSADIPFPW